jgi:hypothetical protein
MLKEFLLMLLCVQVIGWIARQPDTLATLREVTLDRFVDTDKHRVVSCEASVTFHDALVRYCDFNCVATLCSRHTACHGLGAY